MTVPPLAVGVSKQQLVIAARCVLPDCPTPVPLQQQTAARQPLQPLAGHFLKQAQAPTKRQILQRKCMEQS